MCEYCGKYIKKIYEHIKSCKAKYELNMITINNPSFSKSRNNNIESSVNTFKELLNNKNQNISKSGNLAILNAEDKLSTNYDLF